MKRILRGLGALLVLGVVGLAAPLALLRWGHHVLAPSSLLRPDDGSLLLFVLTWLGWLAWGLFGLATVAEALRLALGFQLRLPLLGGLQQLSSGLLLAVLALAPASSQSDAVAQPTVVVAASASPVPDRPAVESAAADGYQVSEGDDLWSISQAVLGDGTRWRELVAANPEALQDPTVRLQAGTVLALPANAHRPKQVVVERGDTLSELALEHLGAARRWPAIAAANSDLIRDPDHIEVGWKLDLPASQLAASPELHRDAEDGAGQAGDGAGSDGAAGSEMPGPEVADSETGAPGTAVPQTAAPTAEPPSATTEADPAAGPADALADPEPPRPAASPEAVDQAAPADQPPPDANRPPMLGVLGTLAAAAIIGVLETKRRLRLRERPIGRRLLPPDDSAAALRAAIGASRRPDRMVALDAALRRIGAHCHRHGYSLPALAQLRLEASGMRFDWADAPPPPPSGFVATGPSWWLPSARWESEAGQWPCPYPAVVSLGSTADGETLLVDAERSRVLGVAAANGELRRSALAAIGVELACAPWSQEAQLLVAGSDTELLAVAGTERVETSPSVPAALERLRQVVATRRQALAGTDLSALRVDPDRADAVAPVVFLLNAEIGAAHVTELDELLAGPACGVAVILGTDSAAPAQWQVSGDAYAPSGRLDGDPVPLRAHGIPEATRVGVTALFRTADDPADAPAPWWGEAADNVRPLPQRARLGEDQMEIVRFVTAAEHPQVLLIGPAELVGARGPDAPRSRQQLVELAAWLLQHPGRSATEMSAGMALAESTRRSNLSRLRAWLGNDADGNPYLPDAYTGRIRLHAGITSDWDRLELLLQPGIERSADAALVAALELVRGAPLADAAPGQWHWAEELRTDIASALRDVGLVLTDRALASGDLDLARWAASRALVVAPEDEQLLCARIRTEHQAGNAVEVERLVTQVTRQARLLGVDLLPATIELCQEVIEGRLRAHRA